MAVAWIGKTLSKMKKQVDDLYVWHAKEDDDGVKVWYVRHSLEAAIIRLSDNIEKQTSLLTKMLNKMDMTERTIESLEEEIKKQ